jgi:hypothetical protein
VLEVSGTEATIPPGSPTASGGNLEGPLQSTNAGQSDIFDTSVLHKVNYLIFLERANMSGITGCFGDFVSPSSPAFIGESV